MEEFPSNAHNQKPAPEKKEEAPRARRVVRGEVVQRKKPLGKRFRETFFGGTASGVAHYILNDVLVPAAKDTITDVVTQGIERTLYGDVRSTGRRMGRLPGASQSQISYNRFGGNPVAQRREDPRAAPSLSRQARRHHNFDEIVIPSRPEAMEVIEQLYEILSKYGAASVADLYDMCNITGDYTDTKWGWTSLQGLQPVRANGGFVLDLPRPEALN